MGEPRDYTFKLRVKSAIELLGTMGGKKIASCCIMLLSISSPVGALRSHVNLGAEDRTRRAALRHRIRSHGEDDFHRTGPMTETSALHLSQDGVHYIQYDWRKEEEYLPSIRQLISKDLSEPYSIYVYRYFLYQWSDLCFMVHIKIPKQFKSGQ